MLSLSDASVRELRQDGVAHDHPKPEHLGDERLWTRGQLLAPSTREGEPSELVPHLLEESRDL